MDTQHELSLWHAVYHLETRYWHEVDRNGGRNAHEFYLPDGLMVVGHNRFQGREKIREFYEWRERHAATAISSVKTTRHLVNNLFVEFERRPPRQGPGHHQLLRSGRPAAGAAVQAPDAGRRSGQRMRAGRGQQVAIQVPCAAAGVHESRGTTVAGDRYASLGFPQDADLARPVTAAPDPGIGRLRRGRELLR